MPRIIPGAVLKYDGQFVIVQHVTKCGVWVRYEEDRTNTEYLVPSSDLS